MKSARLLAMLLALSASIAWWILSSAGAAPPTVVIDGKSPKEKGPTLAEIAPRPEPVPAPDRAELDAVMRKGIDFLVKIQNKNGSWGGPAYKHGVTIYAPVPGGHQAFHNAVTALCISALIECGGERADARAAVERGEVWLMDNLPKLRRATPDALYNIWSHIYGIQAFVRMHQRLADPERRKKIASLIREQIDFLVRYESVDRGWGYYDFRAGTQRPATDSTSFMTAAALVALREAKDIGIDPPEKLIKGAIDSIHRQRKPDFSYLYGE
ncbi:MAG: hypothetical protein HYR84_04355, partial [Planctomycetes bacterium]|nr:hypothetical protein [Planctomycetota bacterium]